jgi:hypothetical protein
VIKREKKIKKNKHANNKLYAHNNTLPPRMALTDETISRRNTFATITTGIQIARG